MVQADVMENAAEQDTAIGRWVAGYERAWASNEPADIRALFTDDAEYRTTPWREPWRGVDAIVEGWIERRDEPGTYTFTWELVDASPAQHYVRGVTTYLDQNGTTDRYSNLWIIALDADGRARTFTEWWMNQAATS
jgi:hypothetical protein